MKSYLTRTVLILSAVSLLADIASELLYPVMPVYLRSVGYSLIAIGLLEGIANVIAGLSKGYFGYLSDQRGKRAPFVQTGYGLSAIGKALLLFSPSLLVIYLSRLVDRLGKGVRTAPRDAMLANEGSEEHQAAVFGFHRGMDTTGAAIGPVLALVWLWFHPGDYKTLFLIAVFPASASWLVTLLLNRKDVVVKKEERGTSRKNYRIFAFLKYWKQSPSTFKKMVGPLIIFAMVNSPDVFLLLTVKAAGFGDRGMLIAYILYNLAYALLSYPAGIFADRYGRKSTVLVGLLLFAIFYAGMAFNHSLMGFVGLFLLYALSMSFTESVVKAVISSTCPENEKGTALGFYSGTNSLGLLVAAAWTGWVGNQFGLPTAFLVTATISIIVMGWLISSGRECTD